MIRTTAPTLSATLSTGLVLDVQDATITLDDSMAPYVMAVLTCAAPAGSVLEAIDPRAALRCTVQLNDHADLFGGTATSRTLDLVVHSRAHDVNSGTLSLALMSDETLLIDTALLLRNVKDWQSTSVRQLCGKILALFGKTLAAGTDDAVIAAGAAVQSPGQSYWDFLEGTLASTNLRLWCDEARVWHLTDKETPAAGQLSLSYTGTVAQLVDTIDLAQEWADSVVIRYSYVDTNGNTETSYDYSGPAAPKRTVTFDFVAPPAVDGAARRLLRRLTGRGRVLEQTAVARFDVVPTQPFIATLPDGAPTQSGLVSAVTWTLPASTMTVRSRELSDTTNAMWAGQPVGTSWASISSGIAWLAYRGLPWTQPPAGETWDSEPAGVRWTEYGQS